MSQKLEDIIAYCHNEVKRFSPYLPDKKIALDIGANVGIYSEIYSGIFEEVHSFEPLFIDELTARTSHIHNIHRHNVALSDADSNVNMLRNPSNSGNSFIDVPTSFMYKSRNKYVEEVAKAKTLDSFNFEGVSFVKIDTEFYVLEILNGAQKFFENNSPLMLIEVPKNECANRNNIMEALSDLGYEEIDSWNCDTLQARKK